jgi:putative acetyltransferase
LTDSPSVIIRPEQSVFVEQIAEIHRTAFGRDVEADLYLQLRELPDFNPKLSLMALYDGKVVGHVVFSAMTIEGVDGVQAFALGPIAVLPDYQGQQIGAALIYEGLEVCRRAKIDVIFLLGHADYYPRFGFVPARERGFTCAYDVPDEAWMMHVLNSEALEGISGMVHFAPEFDAAT